MREKIKSRLMIIDDDVNLNELLKNYLSDFGFDVNTATRPRKGLLSLESGEYDLVVLDVMMPEMDGFAVLKEIRKKSNIPVIMLTARGEVMDRVLGLELGADDYLAKPFEPRELVARIRSILKRSGSDEENGREEITTNSGLELIPARKEAKRNNELLDLTTMEYDMLELLVTKKGRILSRDFIMESLKGYEWEVYDRSIDVAISRVRAKLGDNPGSPRFIKTVRGAGYMFID
ncbi:MAG: DNA-binding response regulator [Acidobacteria bacterium CG_4_9_14_3_um_filter_49_7]|nr:MAG: DNA-binding response regulator [Acidobacteria bacterium CG_4_9_14_3_um_filter_49_7]